MDRMRAGIEKMRHMVNVPHVITVQTENTKAHVAIPEWFSSAEDTRVVVAAMGCASSYHDDGPGDFNFEEAEPEQMAVLVSHRQTLSSIVQHCRGKT